jgi:hypothetical protein
MLAKGCTSMLVPITISRSACCMSASRRLWKRAGRASPKNVMSARTAQDRTGQDRTGQDRTGQDRTGQDRTGQDRTGRDTGHDRAGQDRTAHHISTEHDAFQLDPSQHSLGPQSALMPTSHTMQLHSNPMPTAINCSVRHKGPIIPSHLQ